MVKAKVKFSGRPQLMEVNVTPKDRTIELNGNCYGIENLPWDVPVSGSVYGVLLNYTGALAAFGEAVNEAPYKGAPEAPILYIKPVNTIIGYNMPIPMPSEVKELEVGAALGVVIGQTATRVREEQALEYVAGYTVVNDISIPHESIYRPAISQKARDGFCPVGPWVIERDEVPNPNDLGVRVFVNGELRQENNTRNLIRSVSRLIADITDFMTLYAGDLLLVGAPEGAPLVKEGDRIRIDIDGIGSLENTVVPENELVGGKL